MSRAGQGGEVGSVFRCAVATHLAVHGLRSRTISGLELPDGVHPVRLDFETSDPTDDIRATFTDGRRAYISAKREVKKGRPLNETVAGWIAQVPFLGPNDLLVVAAEDFTGPARDLEKVLRRHRAGLSMETAKERQAFDALTDLLPGRWLLILCDLDDPDIRIKFGSGDWHVVATSHRCGVGVACVQIDPGRTRSLPSVVLSHTRVPNEEAFLRLLCAFAPVPIPLSMLVAGADGAPSELAETLRSRVHLNTVLGALCTSDQVRRTPDTVSVHPAVRENLLANGSGLIGHARNIVMLSANTYVARGVETAAWLPILPHAVTCLTVPAITHGDQSPQSLLDYVNGWEAGNLQHESLGSALANVAEFSSRLELPDIALDFADRRAALAYRRTKRSETELVRVLVQRAIRLRLAGHPKGALVELEQAEILATKPIEPDGTSDRESAFEPPELLIEKAQTLGLLEKLDDALTAMDRLWRLAWAGAPFSTRDTRPYRRVHASLLSQAGREDEALAMLTLNYWAQATMQPIWAADELPDDEEAGRCHYMRAVIYFHQETFNLALEEADRAIFILTELGDKRELQLVLQIRAAALARLNKPGR